MITFTELHALFIYSNVELKLNNKTRIRSDFPKNSVLKKKPIKWTYRANEPTQSEKYNPSDRNEWKELHFQDLFDFFKASKNSARSELEQQIAETYSVSFSENPNKNFFSRNDCLSF